MCLHKRYNVRFVRFQLFNSIIRQPFWTGKCQKTSVQMVDFQSNGCVKTNSFSALDLDECVMRLRKPIILSPQIEFNNRQRSIKKYYEFVTNKIIYLVPKPTKNLRFNFSTFNNSGNQLQIDLNNFKISVTTTVD